MPYLKTFWDILKQRKQWVKITALFFAFVLVLQIVGIVSYKVNSERLSQFNPWQPKYSNSGVPFYARWDSGWYIAVVNYGYYFHWDKNSDVVFFPLYPMLIKVFSLILNFINYYYVGLLISLAALWAALVYFYKLLKLDYSEAQAFFILICLLVFPWSFFLASVYTESLFLLLVLGSFYYARKGNWALASVFGFFACLCRISGIFLLPALFYEYHEQHKKFSADISWLALVPAGLISFIIYLKIKTGYFLAFIYNQSTFGRNTTYPLKTLWWDVRNTFIFLHNHEILKAGVYALGLLALAVSVWLLIVKAKHIRASYLIFAALSIALPLFTGTTTSIGRYLLNAFPVFIAAGLVQSKIFKSAWLTLGAACLLALAFSFVGWYFVV